MDGYQAEANLHKALAHPVRLRILDILAGQEACVCHLTAALGQRQPYVSQQLGTLREAGLVTDRRDGTLVYYRLRDRHLAQLLIQCQRMIQAWDGSVAFDPLPNGPLAHCPCPHCQEALEHSQRSEG